MGGLESVVRMLAEGQRDRGHAVAAGLVVDAGSGPHPLSDALRGAGIAVRELPIPPRRYLEERRRTLELCRELGPTVVHTHGYRADVLGASAARALGIPVVSTVHGFTGGRLRNRFYEAVQRLALRRMNGVAAVSRPLMEGLVRSGVPRRRIRLIPNGWAVRSVPLSRADARARLGLSPDAVVLGWVGRVTPEKGPDLFVETLARLGSAFGTASIVGDGRERPAVTARAEALGVADRVRWHGAVPDAGRLMAAFDVFVLSSRTEGTPIALFEAMAARVPVVATAVGGVPDVITAAEGLLVPGEDPAALAAAIDTVLTRPEAAVARAAAAAERLERVYSATTWLDRYDELYASVQSVRGSP